MANVSQLQPVLPPQVQTSSSEASEKDADFLALRLLNRRARLRLSPAPLDLTSFPGKANLFATANSKGWFAAVTRDASGASALISSPLADLRSALAAASAEDEQSYRPHRRVPIDGATPHILTFACNDTRLLLGLVAGSIHVYASDQLLSSGEGPVQPIHVLTTSSPAPLLSIQSNPGDIPELVAVLRDCTNSPGSLAVELFDVQKHTSSGGWMAGKSPGTVPTSISWSPKGKQLALGLQSGDIVTFSPTATAAPKSSIPHPPSANNMSAISVHWLSTSSFHTIYAPPGQLAPDAEQIHFHVSLDSKSNSAQDIRFNNPYLPFPGLRPPGEFLVCLRGWDPSKVLLFIGDSTSSDIGLIGSVADDSMEHWHNLALEETSTPSLPLDKDQNDTILLGMDVDLTSSESYHHSTASGEALELPAHPVMYVYASDGMVLGWHVLNVTGAPYPGMITGLNASTPALIVPSVPSSIVRELSSDMQTTPAISPTTPAPVETSASKPPSTVFGQPSAFGAQGSVFGQPSVFDQTQSGFSQQPTSAFGKAPTFGQSATIPAFGSTSTPSLFGQSSTSAFGSAAPSVGFGAFTSTGPAKFGQPSFGFGGPPQVTPTPPPSTSVPEDSMAADDAPSLSGFGLGAANSEDADSKPSIFGKPSASGQQSTDGSLIKPGTGFGAFAGFDQKSPFAKPSAFSGTQQSTTIFGVSAFQGATANVFGKPAESPEPKTPLGILSKTTDASTTPSPFTTVPAFSFGVRDSIARDDDSRSPSPAPVQPKVTTSSVFSSSTLGPSTGAFSNLQTTPSAFVKPASGSFGELPKDSPFFAPKPPESKPVSAFALATTPSTPASTPPKASSAQPTFGAASMPGVTFKSAFPPVAAAPAQTAPASASSAFGAFSSGGGGFAAFSSGGSKSFSDLLRSTGEDKSPKADEPKTVEVKASEASVEPKMATETVTIQEPSLESISSSTSSSFVQVSAEEECEMESEEESEVSSSSSDEEETEEQSTEGI
ncbi:hypothetical protein HD554DRAFT_1073297 [Boletus coccyginus]|nr:hypothetical protein HD554DRAFT_1073297 [Boletus coccyginus]